MFGVVRTDFGRPLPALRSAAYPVVLIRRQIFCAVLNFHSLYRYARITAFALHPCSRSVCIRILSACDTFPILTALTKCWLLTAILPSLFTGVGGASIAVVLSVACSKFFFYYFFIISILVIL